MSFGKQRFANVARSTITKTRTHPLGVATFLTMLLVRVFYNIAVFKWDLQIGIEGGHGVAQKVSY